MPNSLVVYCGGNSHGKHDGDLFRAEALALRSYYQSDTRRVFVADLDTDGTHGWVRRSRFVQTARTCGEVDHVAVCCHGTSHWIQAGFRTQDRTIGIIADEVERIAVQPLSVALYCCSTADGDDDDTHEIGPATDGGLADTLRDMLCVRGVRDVRVFAHKTAGHATCNPYVVEFRGPDPARGGAWLIAPGSELWPKWRDALRGPLRLGFPTMTRTSIEATLRARTT